MERGDDVPCVVEAPESGLVACFAVVVFLLRYACVGAFGLPCCGELDEVCDEQVRGDEQVEEQAGDDV
jgi:hypothetical protein